MVRTQAAAIAGLYEPLAFAFLNWQTTQTQQIRRLPPHAPKQVFPHSFTLQPFGKKIGAKKKGGKKAVIFCDEPRCFFGGFFPPVFLNSPCYEMPETAIKEINKKVKEIE
jgi:hypothetical protein